MSCTASRPPRSTCAALLGLLLGVAGCADNPGLPGGARNAEALQMRLADATLAAGAPATALRVLDERLQQSPGDVPALIRRGRALAALGRPADAAQSFSAALAGQPSSMDALIGLAGARAATGEAAEAESAWRRALARAPDDARVQTGLAISLDLQAKHQEAQALYHAVLARAPDDVIASADLGLSLALSGHAAEGLPLLQRAAQGGFDGEHAGATVRARHNLAVGLVMAGDEPGARRLLNQDLAPSDVNAALTGLRQFAAVQ